MDFIRPESVYSRLEKRSLGRLEVLPLCAGAFFQGSMISHPIAQKTSMRDHDPIVYAKAADI